MVRDLLIFRKENYKVRIIISYKDGDEVSKFIIECKNVKISKNEVVVILNRGEFFDGPIFKFDIPEGFSEKIEKWMFINGKYDFSDTMHLATNRMPTKYYDVRGQIDENLI